MYQMIPHDLQVVMYFWLCLDTENSIDKVKLYLPVLLMKWQKSDVLTWNLCILVFHYQTVNWRL